MIIAKKGKNINPNIVINDTVTTFIGITKLSGFAIILNANIVNPDEQKKIVGRFVIFGGVNPHGRKAEKVRSKLSRSQIAVINKEG